MGEASLQTLCLSLTHANQLQYHVRHPDSSSIIAAIVGEEKSHGVFLPSPQCICSFPSLPPGPSLPLTLRRLHLLHHRDTGRGHLGISPVTLWSNAMHRLCSWTLSAFEGT